MLGKATGEKRYLEAARQIVPLLPPRGVQHCHGYLSTLRGALMLHEATGDATLLQHVEKLYADLLASSDTIVDGSVLEYFGWGDPANAPALEAAKAASGQLPRNEGCGLADLIRLALDLFRTTGKAAYLEQAERCIVNAFDHNQFATGDFGSRVWFPDGFTPTPRWIAPGGAAPCTATAPSPTSWSAPWWPRGLERASTCSSTSMPDPAVSKCAAAPPGSRCAWARDWPDRSASASPPGFPRWRCGSMVEPVTARAEGGYLEVARSLAAGDQVDAAFPYRRGSSRRTDRSIRSSLARRSATRRPSTAVPSSWAWTRPSTRCSSASPGPPTSSTSPLMPRPLPMPKGRLRLPVRYEHEGFPGVLETVLRPMGEKPADDQRTLAVWLNFRRA